MQQQQQPCGKRQPSAVTGSAKSHQPVPKRKSVTVLHVGTRSIYVGDVSSNDRFGVSVEQPAQLAEDAVRLGRSSAID